MIDGAMHHGTAMDVEANYTDTHGQSIIGFGLTRLLGFDLLPRIKAINRVRLYRAPWRSTRPGAPPWPSPATCSPGCGYWPSTTTSTCAEPARPPYAGHCSTCPPASCAAPANG